MSAIPLEDVVLENDGDAAEGHYQRVLHRS